MAYPGLGILPNDVNRDPRSDVALVFITLPDVVEKATMAAWLTGLKGLVDTFESESVPGHPDATAIVALGCHFFSRYSDLAANNPHGLTALPSMQGDPLTADVVLHTTFLVESRFADLLRGLAALQPPLKSVEVERGYARADGRETFGQRDGLRNLTGDQRRAHTKIDLDEFPEEPNWLQGGCYGTYLKIEQNISVWSALDPTAREQIMGRHEKDGLRLDLPAGDDPKAEGDFNDPGTPPVTSHVRKAGPRGSFHDQTLVFRRGAPYAEEVDGALHFGLQFVSYENCLDDFNVVFNQWMLNPNFPTPGAGVDALFDPSKGLVTFRRNAIFVVVPVDDRFPAAGYFDPPEEDGHPIAARVHIRKSAVDPNGVPTAAEVGGIQFQMFDPTSGAAIGEPVITNSAGRAILEGARVEQSILVREAPAERFESTPDIPVTIDKKNVVVRVVNKLKPAANPYGT